ncbi:MAG: DUF401 family protein [Acidobacteriota bacterium]
MTFASILMVTRLKVPLGLSILLHSLLLTAWSGAGTEGFLHQAESLLLPENYLLLVLIYLLLFFTEALNVTGRMEQTVNALKRRFRSMRFLIAGLPALVGLLPMPGGALISAPLLDSVDTRKQLDPAHKSILNYWFRHIWEYWWPLYPGVIMAVKYAAIPAGLFFMIQMPFTIAAAVIGYFLLLRRVNTEDRVGDGEALDFGAVSSTLVPIGLLVGTSIAGSFLLPLSGLNDTLANIVSVLLGLLLALLLVFHNNGRVLRKAARMTRSKSTWLMMLVVLGIQAFSTTLKTPLGHGATLVSLMRDEFFAIGVPLVLVMIAIPFVSGAVTGVALGFVGASFPLVFALLGHAPPLNELVATCALAYGSGYMGMIMSPVHICYVVSNQYFKTGMHETYRYLWRSVILMFAVSFFLAGTYYLAF